MGNITSFFLITPFLRGQVLHSFSVIMMVYIIAVIVVKGIANDLRLSWKMAQVEMHFLYQVYNLFSS